MKLIADKYVSDLLMIERTWRERLLSRPWQPLKKHKTIYCPRVYKTIWQNEDTNICSYQTYAYFQKHGKLPHEAKVICVGTTYL